MDAPKLLNCYRGHFDGTAYKTAERSCWKCACHRKLKEWHNFLGLKVIRHTRKQHELQNSKARSKFTEHLNNFLILHERNKVRNINPSSDDCTPLLWNLRWQQMSWKVKVLSWTWRNFLRYCCFTTPDSEAIKNVYYSLVPSSVRDVWT